MDPTYAEQYQELCRRHWWWRSREHLVVGLLQRWKPKGGWNAALDIGCGGGVLFPQLRAVARTVEGIEPDPALAAAGRDSGGVIHARSFDGSFLPTVAPDLVVMLDVLEHLPDARAALAQVHRITAPQATIMITVPAFRWLWTGHDDLNHHVTRFSRAELVGLASETGFNVRDARYFFHWLVGPKLLTRGLEALRGPRVASPRIPPRFINTVLEAGSILEQKLLTPLGVPWGSSLLAVLERKPAANAGR